MTHQWTEFQRSCVQHLAGLLHSIRGLVSTLDQEALEHYCHHGCLGNASIERVKQAEFMKPDVDERSEDENDEDGLADLDEESEDRGEESEDEDEESEDEDEEYEDGE